MSFLYRMNVKVNCECHVLLLPQVLRPLLYQLDMTLLERLVDKLRLQPADEVIEDTVAFIRDMAEATQQV